MGDKIQTNTASVWLNDEGIVEAVFRDDVVDTLENAKENVRAGIEAGGGIKRPLLLDISRLRSMTKEARTYYAKGHEREGIELAVGMIVASPLSRVIGNFFLGLNRSDIPARLFTSRAEAFRWLKIFMEYTLDLPVSWPRCSPPPDKNVFIEQPATHSGPGGQDLAGQILPPGRGRAGADRLTVFPRVG
jgi:hypothetical protein